MRKKLITLFAVFFMGFINIHAQDEQVKSFDIYGFIMMDAGYNANQIHPDWFDVVRPTKLPSYENEYGTNGNFFFSVRQTRLGFKSSTPTALGTLKTQFEFEMFGTGVDEGQTTIRLRHAYAELGKFGVGQYWSPFMDIDVFPNTVEYWGPNGMVFFRNVQFRYMPIQGETRLTFALERPGASADGGSYADRVELQGVRAKFPVPDLSFEYRHALKIGYVELAGIARWMQWEDLDNIGVDYSGNAVGWGVNLSTNLKLGADNIFRGQFVYGEGIQNYMNDAPVDVAIDNDKGVAVPMFGAVAFVDHTWSEKFTTSLGWSMLDIQNTDGQFDDAFSLGHYAVGNLMYYPVENAMMGVELQYGTRENYNDGWDTNIFKVQFSFKYNFAIGFGK
ncbi:MAG: DcaP family trimeric outer membrane transporter [Bacteroidales bacterium]